jgi:hypothetical protein
MDNLDKDIATVNNLKLLLIEGEHDSSLFCQFVKAFKQAHEYQGISPRAFAEVLFSNIIAQGLKTREMACILGHLCHSNYSYDFINGEIASEVLPTLSEYEQLKIREYFDNRFDYPL